jgi:hypothetical protein
MGYSAAIEKRAACLAGAVAAAFAESALSPATAVYFQAADLAGSFGLPRLAALAAGVAVLSAAALAVGAYARPLSRKAAFASGFCAIAVLALLTP